MHQWIGGHLRRRAGVGVGGQGESAAAQNFEAEVAAAFGPFVGLFGQDGADEAVGTLVSHDGVQITVLEGGARKTFAAADVARVRLHFEF